MDFQKILLEKRSKIEEMASKNGKYDLEGRLVISKDDEWRKY